MLKNLLLIFFLFISGEFFLQENNKKDSTVNNQKLIGTNVDFEFIDNLDFPKFIEVEKDTFNDKVISLDTTKKISFSKEQVDLGIKFEEIPYEKKNLFPEEPIPVKSSQFSELKINNKIIEELHIKKELSLTYFKILIDNDKNIWIIGMEKIIRFDGSYFHIYNLIENFGFENINPNTAVIDIKGNIWFGTKNQILKFDGSKLTCFNNFFDVKLKNQKYNSRYGDRFAEVKKIICHENEVFFSSYDEKMNVNIFKLSNKKLYKIKSDSSEFFNWGISLNSIENYSKVIVLKWEYDYEKFEQLKKEAKPGQSLNYPIKHKIFSISDYKSFRYIFKEKEKDYNFEVFDHCSDSLGNFWLSTSDGILKIKDENVSFYNFINLKNKIPSLNVYNSTKFIENDKNKILFECQNGIYEYNYLKGRFKLDLRFNIEDYNVSYIMMSGNNFWLTTTSVIRKIKDFDVRNINKIKNNKIFPENRANFSVSFITFENEDIWSLIETKGIVKISENSINILDYKDEITFKGKRNIIENQVLTKGRDKNIIYGYKSFLKDSIFLNVVKFNTFTNKYSILKFFPKYENVLNKREEILNIYEDSRNILWIATISGLYRYSNGDLTFYSGQYNFKSKPINNIYEDQSNNIWLLHENSFTKFYNENLTYYDKKINFNPKKINSFIEFESGNYWVSTSDGLFNFDGENFMNYNVKKGLKNNFVRFFIEDFNGRKIICHENSLDELKIVAGKIETHNIVNGEFSRINGVNSYSITNDNIFIIQQNGNEFLKVNLNELEKLNKSLKINLDKIYVNDKLIDFKNLQEFRNSDTIEYNVNDIELDQIKFSSINNRYNYPINLKLPYFYNHITFFFDGIKWENQSNVNYEYKIDKLDKKWRNSTETRAEYRNLPPGKHKFMIRGKSSFSKWSEPFIYEFTITPPWWKSWYARLAYIFIVILLIWRVIKYRTQSLEKKQKELELEIAKATDEIQTAYVTLEEQHNEIKDSIKYAKRIQNAILPNVELMKENFKDCYVLYMPKDVVAGDFFWMEKIEDSIYFAAADCTGHGVPGAMISVICSNALSKALLEDGIRSTGKLLDKTREIVIQNLAKSGEEVKDGMDISLCCLNLKTKVLYSSGANNPVLILRKESSDFDIIKADRQPVGLYSHAKPFKEHKTQLEKGDKVYIFTDGYQDQFGGKKGKKLMPKKFKKLLLDSNQLSMEQQKETLENEFNSWRGELEQIDDVCVIGVEI